MNKHGAPGVLAAVVLLAPGGVRADAPLPPWVAADDVPLAAWARSVSPKLGERGQPGDLELVAGPNRPGEKRGLTRPGASLPIFGAARGSGCAGKWWLVGPLAWTCSDGATLSADEASAPEPAVTADGLPFQYFFVGREGASAYASLDAAEDGAADRELDGGWAVAIVEQRSAAGGQGGNWGRTSKGLWIAMHDLAAARPSPFHGVRLPGGVLDVAWVVAERAEMRPSPSPKEKPKGGRQRFDLVHVLEEVGEFARVGDSEWVLSRDLARPGVAAPPADVTSPGERWIDVELTTQTLVAYEGARPVYATLVSTGRGPRGSESATAPGVHRIWVKLLTSDMESGANDDPSAHYSLEDVPYVQFFDRNIALHGTYWHRDFGHVRSHGCVNLAPLDARWLFDFTEPHLPHGWVAAYPTPIDEGTIVRVR